MCRYFSLAIIALFLMSTVVRAGPFTDVPDSDRDSRAIARMADEGFMVGNPDGSFGPDVQVNRYELCIILARVWDSWLVPAFEARGTSIRTAVQFHPTFSDLPYDHWAYDAVTIMAAEGIINPVNPDRTYLGEALENRLELAFVLNRIWVRVQTGLGEQADSSGSRSSAFSDVQYGSTGYDAIMSVAGERFMVGYPDGLWHPEYIVTRRDLALVLSSFFAKVDPLLRASSIIVQPPASNTGPPQRPTESGIERQDPLEAPPAQDRRSDRFPVPVPPSSGCEGADESEPNDIPDDADIIETLQIRGRICRNDVDWFILNGQEGYKPEITLTCNADSCDIDLEVFSGADYVGVLNATESSDASEFDVPGSCYLRVYAFDGEGDYTIAVRATEEPIDSAPAPVSADNPRARMEASLDESISLMSDMGYEALQWDTGLVSSDQMWTYSFPVEQGHSYLILAKGGDDITDLDLYVYHEKEHEDGEPFISDSQTDAVPVVEFSADRSETVKVDVLAYAFVTGVTKDYYCILFCEKKQ